MYPSRGYNASARRQCQRLLPMTVRIRHYGRAHPAAHAFSLAAASLFITPRIGSSQLMSALSNLSIKLRLVILSAFALILLIILSIVSVNALSNAARSLKTVYHDRLIPTGQLGRIELAVQTIQTELLL
ncbi:MAG: hypothetical protein CMK75_02380 [Pseudomonadales bacterium]|nr:hypothetical protein [Pseudomonadales bacterium]